jgi:hypothetical protein
MYCFRSSGSTLKPPGCQQVALDAAIARVEALGNSRRPDVQRHQVVVGGLVLDCVPASGARTTHSMTTILCSSSHTISMRGVLLLAALLCTQRWLASIVAMTTNLQVRAATVKLLSLTNT